MESSLAQMLYMAEEINMGGAISAIKYSKSKWQHPSKHTNQSMDGKYKYSTFPTERITCRYAFTLVFDGTIDVTATGPFELSIPLDTPFLMQETTCV